MKLLENKTVLIIGLGLIGGSIARGLSSAVPGVRILAHGRDEAALQSALIDGNIHAYSTTLDTVASQADIIMLCTPTLTVRAMLEHLQNLVGPDVVITDAASVKGNIVGDARRFFSGSLHRFIPGHPIAGSEQSGYTASRPDLFINRKVILTPLPENSTLAVRTVMQLWQTLGADVHGMTPERHDEVLAGTSHLPHLLAYTLVNTLVDSVSEKDRSRQVFDYAAGGFADFSRIASSDPYMWRDIFLANRDATVDVLDAYINSLNEMRHRLLKGDGDGLQYEFTRAKRVRDEFIRRFRSSAVDAESSVLAGFTSEPDALVVRPGSSLIGTYRPPASLSVALTALTDSANAPGITRIDGFPESSEALKTVHELRKAGVPIVGPERGTIWVYGSNDSAESTATSLPADPFITGLMLLGATILPGSSVYIAAVNRTQKPGSMLDCLQRLGVEFEFTHPAGKESELICISSVLAGADLDLTKTALSDDELLIIITAAALAAGESSLLINADRAGLVLENCADVLGWAADITLQDGLMRVSPKTLTGTEMDLSRNVDATLLAIVVAQKASGQLLVNRPGELAERFPGLLQVMMDMGFGLQIK